MECPRCNDDPCSCQRSLEVVRKASDWIIYDCATAGCRVKIRVRVGQQADHPVCKWCLKEQAYNTRLELERRFEDGPLLSKEEFGLDLFDAIKANAARLQALRDGDKEQVARWEKELNVLFPKLANPDDVRRILAMQ